MPLPAFAHRDFHVRMSSNDDRVSLEPSPPRSSRSSCDFRDSGAYPVRFAHAPRGLGRDLPPAAASGKDALSWPNSREREARVTDSRAAGRAVTGVLGSELARISTFAGTNPKNDLDICGLGDDKQLMNAVWSHLVRKRSQMALSRAERQLDRSAFDSRSRQSRAAKGWMNE